MTPGGGCRAAHVRFRAARRRRRSISRWCSTACTAVVNEQGGTAYAARITDPGMAMGGKSGTSQVRHISEAEREHGSRKAPSMPWKERDHALFISFAPVERAALCLRRRGRAWRRQRRRRLGAWRRRSAATCCSRRRSAIPPQSRAGAALRRAADRGAAAERARWPDASIYGGRAAEPRGEAAAASIGAWCCCSPRSPASASPCSIPPPTAVWQPWAEQAGDPLWRRRSSSCWRWRWSISASGSRAAYWFYGVALLLLVAVELRGAIGMGAQRWIDLGIIQLQPSELMKIALVLALARYFQRLSGEEIGTAACV